MSESEDRLEKDPYTGLWQIVDWTCAVCGTGNRKADFYCKGGARHKAALVKQRPERLAQRIAKEKENGPPKSLYELFQSTAYDKKPPTQEEKP